MSNSVDPDETAHEPSHLDLCCLQKYIIIACGSERVKRETSCLNRRREDGEGENRVSIPAGVGGSVGCAV